MTIKGQKVGCASELLVEACKRATAHWYMADAWRGLQSGASTPDESRLKTPETTPPLIPTNLATAPRLQLRNRLNLKEGKLHPHYPRVVRGRDTQLESHKNTREAFSNLTTGQMLGYGSAGVLAGASIYAYGIADDAIVPLLLCLIAILLSWIGPQIIHELMELNDQLAGRSLEFHERAFPDPFLGKGHALI